MSFHYSQLKKRPSLPYEHGNLVPLATRTLQPPAYMGSRIPRLVELRANHGIPRLRILLYKPSMHYNVINRLVGLYGTLEFS